MPQRFAARMANTCLLEDQFLSTSERPVEFAADGEYVA